MKIGMIKITVIVFVSLVTSHLQADLAGDAARTSAATAAAMLAHENVIKMKREIELKRYPLSQLENATNDVIVREQQQFKKKTVRSHERLVNMQQELKNIEAKADQIIKKTNLQLQDSQQLLAILQQAKLAQEVATAQSAVAKLQAIINDVSELLKSQRAALDNLQKTTAALEQ